MKRINIPKQDLINYYSIMRLSSHQIGKIYDCNNHTILNRMNEYNIPIRSISETLIGNQRRKGKKHSEETKKKMSEIKQKEKSTAWKGDNVGYRALHDYIRKYKPKPEYCTICNEYGKKLHCCSIDHTYTRNLEDWIYLCVKCHSLFDKYRKESVSI